MKILLISDVESPYLYEYYNKENFKDIELILSAGDLRANYLSFLATVINAPLLYIHGNHDCSFEENPPEGCICIEDSVYNFKGIKIAGFGGCMEYIGGLHQYSEKAMSKRIKKSKRKLRNGFDILLTHSPAFDLGDGKDQAHIGFKVFVDLLDEFKPKYMIHGHQHLNYSNDKRIINYNESTIINSFGYYILEY